MFDCACRFLRHRWRCMSRSRTSRSRPHPRDRGRLSSPHSRYLAQHNHLRRGRARGCRNCAHESSALHRRSRCNHPSRTSCPRRRVQGRDLLRNSESWCQSPSSRLHRGRARGWCTFDCACGFLHHRWRCMSRSRTSRSRHRPRDKGRLSSPHSRCLVRGNRLRRERARGCRNCAHAFSPLRRR